MYDTVEEARQKLEGSVVLFEGKPVYITLAGGGRHQVVLGYQHLPTSRDKPPEQAKITDPRWDFKSIAQKIGNVPVMSRRSGVWGTVFLSRLPIRHSRQGLDHRTVNIDYPDLDPGEVPLDWQTILNVSGLNDTVQNIYPSAKTAFDKITSEPKVYRSIPIHRRFLLNYDRVSPPSLFYRKEKIAYTEDGERFKLAQHKSFLAEELTDIIGLKIAG